ncbi:MAG: Do family serine endopeptidase, partial [Pseudomonadota bacterium]
MKRLIRLASLPTLSVVALGLGLAVSAPSYAQKSLELDQLMQGKASIPQLSFADLVEEVSPAVVSIRTTRDVQSRTFDDLPPDLERLLPGLRDRFGGALGDGQRRRATGEGSGFFINDQGHIVTNNHVVQGADDITVVLTSGEELVAELVGTDPETDLAVLKVEPSSDQRYVRFNTSANLRVGDYVLAVGNPFGLGGTVTSGIVSAIGRDGGPNTTYADFIQIDASINRGNSGGPTFDLRGNVIGVNTAIVSPTGVNAGIGLAIPADVAATVTDQIISTGSVTRGFLGVLVRDPEPQILSAVGLETEGGALVSDVTDGSPADDAGIEAGDIVLELNGEEVADSTALTRKVGAMSPGERVRVKLFREGKTKTVRVELGRRELERTASNDMGNGTSESQTTEQLGVSFQSLDEAIRRRLGIDDDVEGVLVVDVKRDSEAAAVGIIPGMIITQADYQ